MSQSCKEGTVEVREVKTTILSSSFLELYFRVIRQGLGNPNVFTLKMEGSPSVMFISEGLPGWSSMDSLSPERDFSWVMAFLIFKFVC